MSCDRGGGGGGARPPVHLKVPVRSADGSGALPRRSRRVATNQTRKAAYSARQGCRCCAATALKATGTCRWRRRDRGSKGRRQASGARALRAAWHAMCTCMHGCVDWWHSQRRCIEWRRERPHKYGRCCPPRRRESASPPRHAALLSRRTRSQQGMASDPRRAEKVRRARLRPLWHATRSSGGMDAHASR